MQNNHCVRIYALLDDRDLIYLPVAGVYVKTATSNIACCRIAATSMRRQQKPIEAVLYVSALAQALYVLGAGLAYFYLHSCTGRRARIRILLCYLGTARVTLAFQYPEWIAN